MCAMAKIKAFPDICLGLQPNGIVILDERRCTAAREGSEALPHLRNVVSDIKASSLKLERRLRSQQHRHRRVDRWLRAVYRLPVIRLALLPFLWLLKGVWRSSRDAIALLAGQMLSTRSRITFKLSTEVVNSYEALASSFGALAAVDRVWLVDQPTGSDGNLDKLLPAHGPTRRLCRLSVGTHRYLQAGGLALIVDSPGRNVHIMPLFLLDERVEAEPRIHALSEVLVTSRDVIYLEEEPPSRDATVVSHTADRPASPRGTGKQKLPFLQYGGLSFQFPNGERLTLLTSRMAQAHDFATAFTQYAAALRALAESNQPEKQLIFEGHAVTSPQADRTFAGSAVAAPNGRWMPALDVTVALAILAALWTLAQPGSWDKLNARIVDSWSSAAQFFEQQTGRLSTTEPTAADGADSEPSERDGAISKATDVDTISSKPTESATSPQALPEALEAFDLDDLMIEATEPDSRAIVTDGEELRVKK